VKVVQRLRSGTAHNAAIENRVLNSALLTSLPA